MSIPTVFLSFEESLKDSPAFRQALVKSEMELNFLQERFTNVTENSRKLVDSGLDFSLKFTQFNESLASLNTCFKDNDRVQLSLQKIIKVYSEYQEMFLTLVEKLKHSHKSFSNFIDTFKLVHVTKKSFERSSDVLDSTLQKSAAMSASKTSDCEEIGRVLSAHQDNFYMTALDYVHHIRSLQQRKNSHILETTLGLVDAHSKYYVHGAEFMKNIKPWLDYIETQIFFVKEQNIAEEKRMENRHSLLKSRKGNNKPNNNSPPVIAKQENVGRVEGYLFKRSTNKTWRNWARKWFLIENNQLLYCYRSESEFNVLEKDLRICTAKPLEHGDRRFCFEIIVPGRTHILQSDSQTDMNRWITSLQAGMSSQMNTLRGGTFIGDNGQQSPSTPAEDPSGLVGESRTRQLSQDYDKKKTQYGRRLLAVPGNDTCGDCGAGQPKWASVNLGVTICTECSSVHRGFGVQISRVRSITLDNWDPEILRVMQCLGNRVVNSVYEGNTEELAAARAEGLSRPPVAGERAQRVTWFQAKWVERRFVRVREPGELGGLAAAGSDETIESVSSGSTDLEAGNNGVLAGLLPSEVQELARSQPSRLLYQAAEARNLALMMEGLALRADVNWSCPDPGSMGRTPLISAIQGGSLAACEFLLVNGAKVNQVDGMKQSALHHACHKQHTQQVCLLLKRAASQTLTDLMGQTPLSIAIGAANADIVTLLRLQTLNDHMKDSECLTGDDTVNDVFKDFTYRAYEMPDDGGCGGREDSGGAAAAAGDDRRPRSSTVL